MSFDFDSSSSSDIANLPHYPGVAHESASSDQDDVNHSLDDDLVESIRNALHRAVGTICRQQDALDTDEATLESPSFTTSNSAIAALTDLTYHYSTTLLANDLVAFSSHAGRKISKPEDVLLMARKDKSGIGDDLKRRMKEIQSKSSNERGKPTGKQSVRKSKSTGEGATNGTSKSRRPASKAAFDSSSSCSSSGDEETALQAMRQRVIQREREKKAQSKQGDDGSDLNDFIVDDNGYYNSHQSDSEIDFQAADPPKTTKHAHVFRDLSDSSD